MEVVKFIRVEHDTAERRVELLENKLITMKEEQKQVLIKKNLEKHKKETLPKMFLLFAFF